MHQRIRVLLIHHDPEFRRTLADGLSKSVCEIFHAHGRADGLPLLFDLHPDLIFLEVRAGNEDGWETFSRIRTLTDTPTVVVAEQPPKGGYRTLPEKQTAVLVGPIAVAEAIAKAKSVFKFPIAVDRDRLGRENKGDTTLSFQVLTRAQVLAVDRALQEIGDFGELRLIVHRGHLRFLAKLKSEMLEPELALPTQGV